jgi:threonine aldolase
MEFLDLRSDTVTLPTESMKLAMFDASLGDDVFGEDPTVIELEQLAAKMFGKEAGLFCTSGTLSNQLAIDAHTQPGDEVICSKIAHIYLFEGGGMARNSLVSAKLIGNELGFFSATEIETNVNNPNDFHLPKTTLVSIEDTSNKGGGAIWQFTELKLIKQTCDRFGLKLHCDGARLFNSLIESKTNLLEYGSVFDSISICLSKGLGAPVGSVLIGSSEFIQNARRRRKSMGGGLRQAGMLAAAGIYALNNNIPRLEIDHQNAKKIAATLSNLTWIKSVLPCNTNIVIAELKDIESAQFVKYCNSIGIRCLPFGKTKFRMVTHLNISSEQTIELCYKLKQLNMSDFHRNINQ